MTLAVTRARTAATDTPLAKHCPAFRKAMDAYESAMARNDEPGMAQAWATAETAAAAFRQGVSFAMERGR